MKFHCRMNLTALLVTILGSRNKNKHSEYWYLTSQRYLLYKFRLEKDKPWVFWSKFRCRTILMHFLLPICGKFTRAQLAHQIFYKAFVFWSAKWIKSIFCQIRQKLCFDPKWRIKIRYFDIILIASNFFPIFFLHSFGVGET
jgi:hypothetical protein